MNKATVAAVIMVMLLLAHWAQGGVSMVRNGSFENNGVIPDIAARAPQYWCDVNIPDRFGGKVNTDWWTHSYNDGNGSSLTLYSKSYWDFVTGDMAMVSQQVYLTDVNEIIFDIELSGAHSAFPWESEYFSAVLQIDGNDVWDSNTLGADGNAEYRNVTVEINDIDINDADLHTLSLVMRANRDETHYFQYQVRWDFVKFDTHCGGFGYLPEDLNHDCYVDILDLGMLAEEWLAEEPAYNCDLLADDEGIVNLRDFAIFASYWRDDTCRQSNGCGGSDFNRSRTVDFADLMIFAEYWLEPVVTLLSDLNTDGAINFKDIAIFANGWLDNTDWENWQDDNCFEIELPVADLDDDGIVNLRDFAVLAGDWMSSGRCIRSDIDGSGVVDYGDISKLTEQWLQKSWLYGLE